MKKRSPEASSGEEGEKTPDAFELAMEAARSGRQQEAFEILIREASSPELGTGPIPAKASTCAGLPFDRRRDHRLPDSCRNSPPRSPNINWRIGSRPTW